MSTDNQTAACINALVAQRAIDAMLPPKEARDACKALFNQRAATIEVGATKIAAGAIPTCYLMTGPSDDVAYILGLAEAVVLPDTQCDALKVPRGMYGVR